MGKIVILGGGFGGIRAALDLEKKIGKYAEITLIDRNAYQLFTPLLYEAASAYGIKQDPFSVKLRKAVTVPYKDILQGRAINFVQGEVVQVDLYEQKITTRGDAVFFYDYLIIGLGGEAADFNIPGVKEYAHRFKTLEDGLMVNKALATLFTEAKDSKQLNPLRIVISGAGFTGVELAAEIACCAKNLARMCGLSERCFIISLLEAGPRILPNITDDERRVIINRLTQLGVVVMENAAVEKIDPDSTTLRNGRTVKHHLAIWTAGIKPNSLLRHIKGLDLTVADKVIVDEHLNTPSFGNVFAVGDNIEFVDHKTQRPEPALAYVAIDHGSVVAKNIIRSIRGKELNNHKPFYNVWVAPVGGKFSVAHLGYGITVSGFLGWAIRQIIDFRYFVSILPLQKALAFLWQEIEVFSQND